MIWTLIGIALLVAGIAAFVIVIDPAALLDVEEDDHDAT